MGMCCTLFYNLFIDFCFINKLTSLLLCLLYVQGLTLNLNSSARTMKSDNNLVLQKVTRNVAGRYACRATNSEGESFSNELTLRIKCKFMNKYDKMFENYLIFVVVYIIFKQKLYFNILQRRQYYKVTIHKGIL